jgi:hypothetical protein
MILISLTPWSPKQIFLFIAGLICLSSAACFATDATLLTVASTPYDRQMSRIYPILNSKTGESSKDNVSIALINHWIADLRSIPYGFSQEWKTPSEVEHGPVADCKGKAVALYQRMSASGAHNVRLVIGRRTAMSRKTHAWLEWSANGATYVLDPTINWAACRSNEIGHHNYIPLYAFAGQKKYRAASGALYAKN